MITFTVTSTATSPPVGTPTGTVTPTLTATRTATLMPTSSVTSLLTSTVTVTQTATSTATFSPTNQGGLTSTTTETQTSTPTNSGQMTSTVTDTMTSTPTNISGMTSTITDTVTSSETSTTTPTTTPTVTGTILVPQAMVTLGTAANYAVLAYSKVTNSGASTLCGSLGLSPLSAVDGGISITCGGVTDVANTAAGQAKLDLGYAYGDASTRPGGASLPAGGDLGGLTLYPGLYTCGGNLNLSSADLTLAAPDSSNTVFIFQVTGNLVIGPGRQVILSGNAVAANVFWVVAGYCSLDTTVSFVGTIMSYTSVTLNTGAVLQGRALAENGDVTLLGNTITLP